MRDAKNQAGARSFKDILLAEITAGTQTGARLLKDTFWKSKPAKIQAGAIVAAIIVMIFVPRMSSDVYVPLYISWIMAYSVMSISWSFFSGKTGYISLATASFYGIGMYMHAFVGRQFPLWTTILFAAALAFAVGIGIGVVTLRLRGIYFTIFTFGLTLFLNRFMHWYEGIVTRTKGRMVKPFPNETVFFALLIVFAITLVAILILNKSKFGLSLKCIGQNEDSAQHLGVKTTRAKVLAFALTAAPVGAVGVIMSTKSGYIDPNTAFGMTHSFFPVLMSIFGGMTSTYGPIVGATIFFVLQDFLMRADDKISFAIFQHKVEFMLGDMVVFGVVMVVVMLLMPKGLFGFVDWIIAKRKKNRGGKVVGDV